MANEVKIELDVIAFWTDKQMIFLIRAKEVIFIFIYLNYVINKINIKSTFSTMFNFIGKIPWLKDHLKIYQLHVYGFYEIRWKKCI